MALFTNNPALAEEFSNPKVSRLYNPDASSQPLSTSPFSRNPFETLGQGFGTGTGSNYGNDGFNLPWTPSLPIDGGPMPGDPYTPYPYPTDPTQPVFPVSDGGGDGDGDGMPTGTGEFDLRDYLENRGAYQTGLGFLSSMIGLPGVLGSIADYNAGINPFAGLAGGTFLDSFGEQAGLTSDYFGGVDFNDLSGYQRDFLTEQLMFDAPTVADREQGLFGGFFDNLFGDYNDISLDYDPALDLTIGDWGGWESETPDAYGGVSAREMLDAGFTTEDIDFIGDALSDSGSDSSDSGGDTSGGSYSADDAGDAAAESDFGGGYSGGYTGGGFTDDW